MVVDLRHYLGLPEDTPAPGRRMAAQLGDVVRAATVGDAGPAWESALPCRRRPAHRTCLGRTVVQCLVAGGPIRWQCTRCDDTGTISRWEGSPFDLRPPGLTAVEATTDVVVPDDVAAALPDLQLLDPQCERLVYGLRAHPDGTVLSVSDAELEDLVGAVAAEANHEPDRRRQQRLDRAYDALDTALNATTSAGW